MFGSIQRTLDNKDMPPKVNIVLHTATLVSHIYWWYIHDIVCIHRLDTVEAHRLIDSRWLPKHLTYWVYISTTFIGNSQLTWLPKRLTYSN